MTKKTKATPVVETEVKECSKTACCSKKEGCNTEKETTCCGSNCCCKKSHSDFNKTFAKCFTTIMSALMITTAILWVGDTMTSPSISSNAGGNLELQLNSYMRKNASLITQILEEEQGRIEEERRLEEERARIEAEKRQAEKLATYTETITKDDTNYALGNKDGKFVIIEFFDYRCGWCKRTNKAIWAEIDAKKAPNIKWIPIDAPIFGEDSALISRYVLAAGKQGKYTEMHHAVVEAEGTLNETALTEIAKKIGLNVETLKKDAESDELKAKIDSNVKMAQEIGVSGVPFMIVNGKPHGGALLGDALANAVKESNEMK